LENTFQIDYVLPINKKITFETGTKLILRDINSDFAYKNYSNDLKNFVTDITRSDIFFYIQNVMAGYVSVNLKLGEKWGLIAGSRYEQTFLNGDYDKSEVSFTNTYDNFLPSVTLNRKLSSFSNIKFSYAKRIQRPSLRYINPYVEIEDPRDVTVGNPEVEPPLASDNPRYNCARMAASNPDPGRWSQSAAAQADYPAPEAESRAWRCATSPAMGPCSAAHLKSTGSNA
jgi:hypothetical protein